MSKYSFSVFQWNCRSIDTNYDLLTQHLSGKNYNVLCLQSLSVQENKIPKLDNYFFPPTFHSDPVNGKVQSAIYVRTNINYTNCACPIPKNTENTYACAIKVKILNFELMVLSVYLPKGPVNTNTNWLQSLKNDSLTRFLVTGDFNAHSPFWGDDNSKITSNTFIENIVDSSLFLLNDNSITRIPDVANHKPSSIDLTLISPDLAPDCNWHPEQDTLNSDHFPLITELCCNSTKTSTNPTDKIPKYNYAKANWEKFKNVLLHTNIDANIFITNDIHSIYSCFCSIVLNAADQAIPRIKTERNNKKAGNVWWNSDCEKARLNKTMALKNYKKNPTPENHSLSKKAKNHCNRTVDQAKRSYWSNYCEHEVDNKTNIKEVWSKIKTLKNGFYNPTYPITIGINELPSDEEKSEAFVEFFSINSQIQGLEKDDRLYRLSEETTAKQNIIQDQILNDSDYVNDYISLSELEQNIKLLPTKKVSTGLDGISNEMLKHLPINLLDFLLSLFNKCWQEGCSPNIWKSSVVTPIYKGGPSAKNINNYRPISLTSHTCKLLEKIILQRIEFFCDKENIIPINQAGFRKKRNTTEHLVKLSTQIKQQFARRKNVLATFFDLRKAYDRIWHTRLLEKLKLYRFQGRIYNYLEDFISNRSIQVRVGTTYSNVKQLDMGLPQGSILSPILFNIFIADLPTILNRDTTLVQFADDICMWRKVTMKRLTPKRSINHIQRVYQNELNNIEKYLKINGLSLSLEKTKIVLFNSGVNPKILPEFHINGTRLQYTENMKFLGVFFNSKLNWSKHISHILTKARKALNLLKVIVSHKWGQDSNILRTLAISLVRSCFLYGQEVFYNAPNSLLKKIQSVDCKAFKVALGVPYHTSNLVTYNEINVLPLDYQRKQAICSFISKVSITQTFCAEEINVTQEANFAKRALNIKSTQPIRSFVQDILDENNIKKEDLIIDKSIKDTPPWRISSPRIDIHTMNLKKEMSPNILKAEFNKHIAEVYKDYLQIYTDGSVLDNGAVGSAFIIPSLKITKQYHLGFNLSIFSAELTAILKALTFICDNDINNKNILLCIDSQSVIHAIKSNTHKIRHTLISKIKELINEIMNNHSYIVICWVPSHCGITNNELVDRAAKKGATNSENTTRSILSYDHHELKSLFTKTINKRFKENLKTNINMHPQYGPHLLNNSIYKSICHQACSFKSRYVYSTIFRLRLDSIKVKYIKNIHCPCGQPLVLDHILHHCNIIKTRLKLLNIKGDDDFTLLSTEDILSNINHLTVICTIINSSILNGMI